MSEYEKNLVFIKQVKEILGIVDISTLVRTTRGKSIASLFLLYRPFPSRSGNSVKVVFAPSGDPMLVKYVSNEVVFSTHLYIGNPLGAAVLFKDAIDGIMPQRIVK